MQIGHSLGFCLFTEESSGQFRTPLDSS